MKIIFLRKKTKEKTFFFFDSKYSQTFFPILGYQYGMMAIKTMLSCILRRFKFTTDLKMEEFEMQFQITLKLLNKHIVGIERREW